VKEMAMKKHRIVEDLLAVVDIYIDVSEARARLLESHGKGPSKKKQDDREVNTTDRGDCEITKIAGITSSSPRIRKRRDSSIALSMQRCCVRSIIPSDMIWESAKLFWITRRCHHQWPRNPIEANITELIPTATDRWEKSM
jgi:hypothetical protein